MYIFLSVLYVLVCLFLILVVLLQQGRGGGMGGAFGGSSQTVFGGAGAGNVLTRATTASAALFMILSATLAWMSSSRDASLEDVLREVEDQNRHALLEAAEDSATDDEPGATEGADEAEVTPPEETEEPTEGATDDEALEDPTEGLAPGGLELPTLELGTEPVEPGVPTLGGGAPTLGGEGLRLGGDSVAPTADDAELPAEGEPEAAPPAE